MYAKMLIAVLTMGFAAGSVTAGEAAKGAAEARAVNFIKNGSFEDLDKKGKLVGWSGGYGTKAGDPVRACCRVVTDEARDGKRSVRFDFSGLGPKKPAKARNEVAVRQGFGRDVIKQLRGKEVVLSAWIRYDGISAVKEHYFPGPLIILRPRGEKGQIPGSKPPDIMLMHNTMHRFGIGSASQVMDRWVKVERRGKIPAGTVRMDLKIEHVAYGYRSKKWNLTSFHIDDVRIEIAGEAANAKGETKGETRKGK